MWSGRKGEDAEELRGKSKKRAGCSLVDTAAARVHTCARACGCVRPVAHCDLCVSRRLGRNRESREEGKHRQFPQDF